MYLLSSYANHQDFEVLSVHKHSSGLGNEGVNFEQLVKVRLNGYTFESIGAYYDGTIVAISAESLNMLVEHSQNR